MKFLWAMLILACLSWTAFAAPGDLTAKFTASGLSSLRSGMPSCWLTANRVSIMSSLKRRRVTRTG